MGPDPNLQSQSAAMQMRFQKRLTHKELQIWGQAPSSGFCPEAVSYRPITEPR